MSAAIRAEGHDIRQDQQFWFYSRGKNTSSSVKLIQASRKNARSRRLERKVRCYAQRYDASLIIIENTARGPDLIDDLRRDIEIRIIPVNPKGSKASRLRRCIPIIRAKRVRIKRNRPVVEEAIDEILAYPNCAYNDHVDALTNFLLEAMKFTLKSFARARRPQLTRGVFVTPRTANPVPARTRNGAIARHQSIFGPAPLPDFSNGRAEPQTRPDGRSPYAVEDSSDPIYSFDGGRMVRIK